MHRLQVAGAVFMMSLLHGQMERVFRPSFFVVGFKRTLEAVQLCHYQLDYPDVTELFLVWRDATEASWSLSRSSTRCQQLTVSILELEVRLFLFQFLLALILLYLAYSTFSVSYERKRKAQEPCGTAHLVSRSVRRRTFGERSCESLLCGS